MLYHIVKPDYWQSHEIQEAYTPETFSEEGFIHLSTQSQVAGVLERYYPNVRPLLLLHLDETRFKALLKFEPSTGGELFPHLYGPLNRDAIVSIEELV
ncbi:MULTISPECIES: DUF952 domain-containing protein [unclassified Siphonobacter]|uniref:DUF952 domain-containing protein n=1 Tax=unclassified Siphonobacter TaxID=2635712 RepID=UPI000CA8E090|nr:MULTISPECIES: DUF952 domain-containing protein [unclassified Siphonobacter]MDQ1085965.1 uncharacterized protein (DUF952 family) [Siphonobacter sp. SORGH_AS_1065]MDR6196291.1 uncharacterized protein (DUF952 family) [Siphonobacter sp. SORGH_AS_0500]PKK38096.1 hypothetical protein BWI96_03195 [Siphonobacter sp. SORGH_AS_0500]